MNRSPSPPNAFQREKRMKMVVLQRKSQEIIPDENALIKLFEIQNQFIELRLEKEIRGGNADEVGDHDSNNLNVLLKTSRSRR